MGYFLLAKQKKVTSCRATPGQWSVVLQRTQLQHTGRTRGIARLLAVCNPDSRQPHKDCGEFEAITSFEQVMPGA